MPSAGAQHGQNQMIGVAIEDQQRMVHVLPIVGMVGRPFLRAIGRIVRPIPVQHDALGHPVALSFTEIELHQCDRQAITGAAVHGIVEAREGGLTGPGRPRMRQAATDELEQRVMAQGVGVVLIFVATRNLEDALADEGFERVLTSARTPLRDIGGDERAEAEGGIRVSQPGQAAIGGAAATVKGRLQGQRRWRRKSRARCGRIRECRIAV